jgi:uncharacterized protein involved in copper resistance
MSAPGVKAELDQRIIQRLIFQPRGKLGLAAGEEPSVTSVVVGVRVWF